MQRDYPSWAKSMRVATWSLTHADLDLSAAEAERRAHALAGRGLNAVVSFGYHFRWDWIEHFKRIRAVIRLSVEACHRHGIRYVEHHSACFVTRLAKRTPAEFAHLESKLANHTVPEPPGMDALVLHEGQDLASWYVLNAASGGADYWPGYRAFSLCANHPDYQRHYLAYLEDLLGHTGADGIMSDDVNMGTSFSACVCPHCQERFTDATGLAYPGDAGLLAWQAEKNAEFDRWREFRSASIRDHYARIGALIGRAGRGLLHTSCATSITIPAAADLYDRQAVHNTTFMEVMHCLHDYHSWRYLAPELRTYRAVARAGGNPSLAIAYPRPTGGEAAFIGAFLRMEGHAAWLAPNHHHPAPAEGGDGDAWIRWEAGHEALFASTDTVAVVAVLFSDASRRRYRGVNRDHYSYEFSGWCQALHEAGIDADVILAEDLERGLAARYRVLVVPNAGCLAMASCRSLEAFVQAGGRLVVSHETSLCDEVGGRRDDFALADCLGVSWLRTVSDEQHPLQAGRGDDGFLAGIRGLIPHRHPQVEVRPHSGTQIVATAYVDGGGLQGGSIPAITRHSHGRGEAVYVAGKPGLHAYLPEVRNNSWDGEEPDRFLDHRLPEWGVLVANIIRVLAGRLPITLSGTRPGVVMRAYRFGDDVVLVHVLNGAGSLVPHRTLVGDYAVTHPEIGVEPVLELRLGRRIAAAELFTPEGAEGETLAVLEGEAVTRVGLAPGRLRSYGVIRLRLA